METLLGNAVTLPALSVDWALAARVQCLVVTRDDGSVEGVIQIYE